MWHARDAYVKVDMWHTRIHRIRNEDIRKKLGVAAIEDKLMESRLRWFSIFVGGRVRHQLGDWKRERIQR